MTTPTRAADGPPWRNLTQAWPTGTALGDISETTIRFPSHSPFSLADVGAGPAVDPPTDALGALFLPEAVSGESLVPAVVLLHGAAGVLGRRELTYARQLASLGVAALVVDVFGARRDRGTGFVDRLINITEAMALADAYAALDYFDSRAEIDASRTVLIGFSYGGMTATYAAYAQVANTYAPDRRRFAGHVAYYAPCIADFHDERTTGAPVLMLWGGQDAIIDAKRCDAVVAELGRGGSAVTVVEYADAYHQWDGGFSGPYRIGRNLAPCRYTVDESGTVYDARLLFPISTPFWRKISLGLCTDAEGYLIGRDDAVRQRSNRALGQFLSRVFSLAKSP